MPQTFNVGSRSLFVTITAWVFIALAALASLSAVVQNAEIASIFPGLGVVGNVQPLPLLTGLLLGYLPWLIGAGLVASVATLACAVGLLLRLEWARRLFIGLLALALVANLVGLWLQQEMLQSVVDATLSRSPLPREAANIFGSFVNAARATVFALSLGACSLLAWIIHRLRSPLIRQEFA